MRAAAAAAARRFCYVPFVKDICPGIDLKGRRLEITPPEGLLDVVSVVRRRGGGGGARAGAAKGGRGDGGGGGRGGRGGGRGGQQAAQKREGQ
jgi:hypothetical protein